MHLRTNIPPLATIAAAIVLQLALSLAGSAVLMKIIDLRIMLPTGDLFLVFAYLGGFYLARTAAVSLGVFAAVILVAHSRIQKKRWLVSGIIFICQAAIGAAHYSKTGAEWLRLHPDGPAFAAGCTLATVLALTWLGWQMLAAYQRIFRVV